MFLRWFDNGRPGSLVFRRTMPPNEDGHIPKDSTLNYWIAKWKKDAEVLDAQIKSELEKRLVKEKVEMLYRHAELGKQMQDIGIDFLTDPGNVDEITSSVAVRMLVAGIEIERESRGLPESLEAVMKQTDEDLINRIAEITKDSPLEIEAITD